MCRRLFQCIFLQSWQREPCLTCLRFFLALLIGVIVAGIFGILIGIPVLRLRGDYLAIVTLAFGEIIKNVINAMYVGVDGSGFHFSLKDSVSLNLDSTGEVIVNGAQGINGTPHDSSFHHRDPAVIADTGYHSEPDQFQRRTRDHGDP